MLQGIESAHRAGARLGLVGWLLAALVACDGAASSDQHRSSRTSQRSSQPSGAAPIPGLEGTTGPQLLQAVRKNKRGALVNLWASWCGNCKKELPILVELGEVYGDHGLGLFLVSVDKEEARPAARALLDELGISRSAHYVAGTVRAFQGAVEPRWQGAIPATLLIDEQGKVRFFWNGPVGAEEVVPVVQRYLAGEDVDGELDVAARPTAG